MPNPVLAELTQAVTNITNAADAAEEALHGVAARIQAAVDQALANGATADELAPVQAEVDLLNREAGELAAAVAAGTGT